MTSSPGSAEQAVAALFAERHQYEAWLSTLEAKRDATPTHIFDRVHADYRARVERTMEQLRSHRAAIQEMENAVADRLTLLDVEEAKQKDQRAEAELRASVGELTLEQCRAAVKNCENAIVALDGDRTTLGIELARLRSVLDGAPSPLDAAAAARLGVEEQRRNGASHGGFDELQFLKSVVESVSGEQDAIGATVASTGAGQSAAMGLPSGLAMRTPAIPSPEVTRSNGFASVRMQTPADVGDSRPNGETRQGSPAFLKEAPEQVKSLKCQECGTLNYPTEWYCERCGAELAAL